MAVTTTRQPRSGHPNARRMRDWPRHGRVWEPAPASPLPAREAGRAEVVALLNGPAGPRHELKTDWDDRRETSLKAVLRQLWRLGHASKSATFATTYEQLQTQLTPVMGWRDRGNAEANRAAHQRSIARWLDDLQAMKLIRWSGVLDNMGRWWRLEVELLAPPGPDADWLEAARCRLRAFGRRERRRRRQNPRRRRDLGRVIDRSARPNSRTRRRLGIARALDRRAARVACAPDSNDSSTPFGALPAVGSDDLKEFDSSALATPETTPNSLHSLAHPATSRSKTGARARVTTSTSPQQHSQIVQRSQLLSPSRNNETQARQNSSIEDEGTVSTRSAQGAQRDVLSLDGLSWNEALARVREHVRRIEAGLEPPTLAMAERATRRRAYESLTRWPAGRHVPRRLLIEAFEYHSGGTPACLAKDKSSADPSPESQPYAPWLTPPDTHWRDQLNRAVMRYGRYADQRPSGWPANGEAALAWAMVDVAEDAQSAVYAIGRLDQVSKQMAAAHKRADADHYERARQRRGERRDDAARERARTSRMRVNGRGPRPATELDEARDILAGRLDRREPTGEQIRLAGARLFVARELVGGEDLLGFHVRGDQLLRPDGQRPSSRFREAIHWLRGMISHQRDQQLLSRRTDAEIDRIHQRRSHDATP